MRFGILHPHGRGGARYQHDMASLTYNAFDCWINLDIRFLPDDFHRVYIAPRQVHSGHDPLLPFFRWVLRVVCLASAKRGGANCHAIEENTGLVEEVETLDDITIANPAWVGDIVFTLFAHLVVLCWAL